MKKKLSFPSDEEIKKMVEPIAKSMIMDFVKLLRESYEGGYDEGYREALKTKKRRR